MVQKYMEKREWWTNNEHFIVPLRARVDPMDMKWSTVLSPGLPIRLNMKQGPTTQSLGGVAAIALVFISYLALPFINTSQTGNASFRPTYKKLFWVQVADCVVSVWTGQQGAGPCFPE
jgi:quinol-cytochrome oxidoreductase complex cytochrome b subunit